MLDMKEALKYNKEEARKTKLLYLFSRSWYEMGKAPKAEIWLS